jgi:hypothetical protein
MTDTVTTGIPVLRDIHGLDAVPWWPLATGWWILFGLLVLLAVAVAMRHWLVYHAPWIGWRGDARRQLRALKKSLAVQEPRIVAGQLSELLRRIAMAHSGRREAAGLSGDEWLSWLAKQDSSQFDWKQRGQLLLTAPYMPPSITVARNELSALIVAARRWIDTATPATLATRPAGIMPRLKQRLRGRPANA